MSPLATQILIAAFGTLGEQESIGTKVNPTILGWIRAWFPRATDDSTIAWCAIWLSTVVSDCGIGVPDKPFRARMWKEWGTKREGPAQVGDVAVLRRKGGHHVGIVLKATDRYVWLVGGNQSNSVNVTRFDASLIEAVRFV
jgi:uncharacterized protein (TIGR02594 family)